MAATQPLRVSIPHHLTVDEARERLQKGIADAKQQFGSKVGRIDDAWTGNRLDFAVSVMAQSLTGRADVTPDHVNVEVDLPWLLAALADKIRGQIQTQGTKLLEKK